MNETIVYHDEAKKTTLFLLLYFFVFGCIENNLEPVNLDVLNAKNWFEVNAPFISGLPSSNQRIGTSYSAKRPNWTKSRVHKLKNGFKAVEVELNYENDLLLAVEGNGEAKRSTLTSMLLIEVIPNFYQVYLIKSYPERLEVNTQRESFDDFNFTDMKKNFTGDIMIFDSNESLIGGWKINRGERDSFYGKIIDTDPEVATGKVSATSSGNCYVVTIYWYSQACSDYGCSDPVIIDETSFQICEEIIAPPSGNPDEGGGGGGGDPGCFVEHPFIEGLMVPCPDEVDQDYNNLTSCEKVLVKDYPGMAYLISENASKAHLKTIELFGQYINGNGHNDCADAFRHAYWNALNARSIGEYFAKSFADAHECDTPINEQKEKDMDLFNNDVGRRAALESPYASEGTLADLILADLAVGNLRYLNPLGENNTIIRGTVLVPTNNDCL